MNTRSFGHHTKSFRRRFSIFQRSRQGQKLALAAACQFRVEALEGRLLLAASPLAATGIYASYLTIGSPLQATEFDYSAITVNPGAPIPIDVRVVGSGTPPQTPTGSVTVEFNGAFGPSISLSGANGTATGSANVTFPTQIVLSSGNAIECFYSGDSYYASTEFSVQGNMLFVNFGSTTNHLAFIQQPSDTVVGGTISPPVTVAVENSSGTIMTSSTDAITLSAPGGNGPLAGTLTENAVNGVATFSDLSINAAGSYTLSASDPGASMAQSNSFMITADALKFLQQPSNAAVGTPVKPAVTVELLDGSNNVVTSDSTSTVTLSPIGTSGGVPITGSPITGNVATLVNGIATFNNLTLTHSGLYKLQATDDTGDGQVTSDKFTIGGANLTLDINARSAKPQVATGDTVFYSLFLKSKKPVAGAVITDVVPAGFVPTGITGGGTFDSSSNTIMWNTLSRVLFFQMKVPSATVLNGLTKIVTSATYTTTFTDGTSDNTTATNTVPIKSSFEVTGVLHDAQFDFPNRSSVALGKFLKGAEIDLFDSTGAMIDTAITKANGQFTVNAGMAGTYTLVFKVPINTYSTASNYITTTSFAYASITVTLPKSSTAPLDLKDVYMSQSLFNTAAKVLMAMNNYKVFGFQSLASSEIDFAQFNTTAIETALSSLAASAASPSPLMNAAALKAGAVLDPWVAAMRMVAGAASIDLRFSASLKLVDYVGKQFAATLSALFAKGVGMALGGKLKKLNLSALPGFSAATAQSSLLAAGRVATFTSIGMTISPALDLAQSRIVPLLIKLGLPAPDLASNKSTIIAAFFSITRFLSDLVTGKLVDDLVFESIFTLAKVLSEGVLIHLFDGVNLRPDVGPPYQTIAGFLNGIPTLSGGTMQDTLNRCVTQSLTYNTATDTQKLFIQLTSGNGDQALFESNVQPTLASLATLGSVLRAGDGVVGLQGKAAFLDPSLGLGLFQSGLQKIGTSLQSVLGEVSKKGTFELQLGLTVTLFSLADFALLQQEVSALNISDIVSGTSAATTSIISAAPVATSVPAPAAGVSPPTAPAQSPAVSPAHAAIAAATDISTYLNDLKQIKALVLENNINGISALDTQFNTDNNALFNNDLIPLDQQAAASLVQLNRDRQTQVDTFDTTLNNTLEAVQLAEVQVQAWGLDTATGNKRAVLTQLQLVITSMASLSAQVGVIRSVVAGQSIPATIVIADASVPSQLAPGATASFSFTVTNVGSAPSSAGTVSFENSDGTLAVQGEATQALPALSPGQSTIVTWQVLGVTASDPNLGSAFQVTSATGDLATGITDTLTVG